MWPLKISKKTTPPSTVVEYSACKCHTFVANLNGFYFFVSYIWKKKTSNIVLLHFKGGCVWWLKLITYFQSVFSHLLCQIQTPNNQSNFYAYVLNKQSSFLFPIHQSTHSYYFQYIDSRYRMRYSGLNGSNVVMLSQ